MSETRGNLSPNAVSMRFVWPPVSWSIIFQFNFSVLFFSAICKWKLRRMFIRFCQKWIIQSLCSIYFLCKLILILFYTVYDESLKFRQTLITGKLAAKRRCQKNPKGGACFFLRHGVWPFSPILLRGRTAINKFCRRWDKANYLFLWGVVWFLISKCLE